MDALSTFQRQQALQYEHEDGVVECREEYKYVPVTSYYTGERLMKILADAIWATAKAHLNPHQNELPRACLESIWDAFNNLPLNTSGCKYWRNNTLTPFPYRQLCYSKTTQTCTLKNTPDKISRLEFMEGVREVLGVYLDWCHLDQVMRIICTAGPLPPRGRTGKAPSRQSITKKQFVTAFWPLVSVLAFEDACGLDPGDYKLDVLNVAGCLKDVSKAGGKDDTPGVAVSAASTAMVDSRTSVIDENDL